MSILPISFFFSSRRRHTRCGRDWSSDVCSSDLVPLAGFFLTGRVELQIEQFAHKKLSQDEMRKALQLLLWKLEALRQWDKDGITRSEERRVGKECRGRWSRYE